MINEPAFEDPGSLFSLMQRFEARRDARERVPHLEVAMIIEKHRGRALPAAFSDYLTQHFRGELEKRLGQSEFVGRPFLRVARDEFAQKLRALVGSAGV